MGAGAADHEHGDHETVVFGKIAGLPSEGETPYPTMVFAAMLPWQFFSNSLSSASQSIVSNADLISKVYFLGLIIPTSSVIVSFIDFLVAGLVLFGMMVWFQFWPTLGPGLITTALTGRYRDFRFIIPFIVANVRA